jgi:hypothetical protein
MPGGLRVRPSAPSALLINDWRLTSAFLRPFLERYCYGDYRKIPT